MIVEFEKLNLKERQMLVLKNLDGTPIQPLVYAHKLSAKLLYNETSEIEFELPAYVDGEKTPHYDDVVGMRLIDWIDVGQFILINPKIKNDGVAEIKSCTAYSLEYEFTYKNIYIPDGTYNFWDPMSPKDTVLGRILELMPSWSTGVIDSDLWNKYRTFEVDNQSVYEFIKGTAQDSFQCIFDFDTYKREINVRSVANATNVEPVYLSMENLIKEIQIEEDTENIVTCVDVNGAEGVDIRSVNPMGTNEIYNLDYFMTESYFPTNVDSTKEIIAKWNQWKEACKKAEVEYYALTIRKTLKESELETARAEAVRLKNELSSLETLKSAYLAGSAAGSNFKDELADVNKQISGADGNGGIKGDIKKQDDLIDDLEDEIDAMYKSQQVINESCNLKNAFSEEEYLILDRYFKKAAITEESFIYKEVTSYSEDDVYSKEKSVSISIDATDVSDIGVDDLEQFIGGTITITCDGRVIEGKLVNGVYERLDDGSSILTARLGAGTNQTRGETDKHEFTVACLTAYGTATDSRSQDENGRWNITLSVAKDAATSMYFTVNPTEFAKRSVEWDLMDYGSQCLEELAWPTYSFSIDAGNFLAMEDFEYFKNHLSLGSKIYLNIKDTNLPTRNAVADGRILTPIVIGVEFDCDDPDNFKLLFGDKYSLKDSAFQMVDLLKESVSMGKTVASNKTNYNAFLESGASTQVKEYMESALDASKNAVLAGASQGVLIDGSGIRLRKWNKEAEDYDPQQIWMINNNIVFTEDNWDSASMAIGNIQCPNGGTLWGVVADALVGKLLAGSSLVIEARSVDESGVLTDNVTFSVDGSGAQLHNARFDLIKGNGQLTLYPETGFIGGVHTSTAPLLNKDAQGNWKVYATDGSVLENVTKIDWSKDDPVLPRANFWIDMEGNAYFKGSVYATDGYFSGEVHATSGEFKGNVTATGGSFSGTVDASSFRLDGVCIDDIFSAMPNANGDLDYLKIGPITIDGTTGTISWGEGANLPKTGLDETEVNKLIDNKMPTIPDVAGILKDQYKITTTELSGTEIKSPTITGNAVRVYGAFEALDANNQVLGYMGGATGMDDTGTVTTGVAISADATTGDFIRYATTGHYVIATTAGCRMQATATDSDGNAQSFNSVVVTDNSVTLEFDNAPSASSKTDAQYSAIKLSAAGCQYKKGSGDWQDIGSGVISGDGTVEYKVTAMWG